MGVHSFCEPAQFDLLTYLWPLYWGRYFLMDPSDHWCYGLTVFARSCSLCFGHVVARDYLQWTLSSTTSMELFWLHENRWPQINYQGSICTRLVKWQGTLLPFLWSHRDCLIYANWSLLFGLFDWNQTLVGDLISSFIAPLLRIFLSNLLLNYSCLHFRSHISWERLESSTLDFGWTFLR